MQEYNFFPNKKDIEKINFFLKIFKITLIRRWLN